jgi:hypothetical protein
MNVAGADGDFGAALASRESNIAVESEPANAIGLRHGMYYSDFPADG